MGKVRRVVAVMRRKEFLLKTVGTFFAILGVASVVLSLADWHLKTVHAILFAAGALLVAAVAQGRKIIEPQLAVEDVLGYEVGSSIGTQLRCPSDRNLASEAKKLAEQCFATSVTIAPETYEQLRAKNSYILAGLFDHSGNMLGYFDAIPVRETFALPFLQGKITEEQITHEDVLAPNEMEGCEYLFLAGIAVWNPNTHAGRRNASILVWALLQYLKKFYGHSHCRVFAVAATQPGDDLLRRFKLNVESEADHRSDRYKLYAIDVTSDEITKRIECLPDWSRLCHLDWDKVGPKAGKRPRRPPLPETKVWNLAHTGAAPIPRR